MLSEYTPRQYESDNLKYTGIAPISLDGWGAYVDIGVKVR
jgi:hypothetical protein